MIAIPPLATREQADQRRNDRNARLAGDAADRVGPPVGQRPDGAAARPEGFLFLPEVTAPTFSRWRAKGARLLLTGFVQARSDGRVTFGCYIYDVRKGREVGRSGFVAAPDDWRRAAHKCSGLVYKAATGAPRHLRYPHRLCRARAASAMRVRRIAIMDSDGYNHNF